MDKVEKIARKICKIGNRKAAKECPQIFERTWDDCQPHIKKAFFAIAKWHIRQIAAAGKK